jgi:hypothetical protein
MAGELLVCKAVHLMIGAAIYPQEADAMARHSTPTPRIDQNG